MSTPGPICFEVADLPLGGVTVEGNVPFHSIGIADDEMTKCPGNLAYRLTIAPVGEGFLVRGSLSGTVARMCDRCLVFGPCEVTVPDVCFHFEHLEGYLLDLTEHVREDIVLALPQRYVCEPGCLGLCPHCGRNLNESACDCARNGPRVDPWSALDTLDFDSGVSA